MQCLSEAKSATYRKRDSLGSHKLIVSFCAFVRISLLLQIHKAVRLHLICKT